MLLITLHDSVLLDKVRWDLLVQVQVQVRVRLEQEREQEREQEQEGTRW